MSGTISLLNTREQSHSTLKRRKPNHTCTDQPSTWFRQIITCPWLVRQCHEKCYFPISLDSTILFLAP